MDFLDPRLEEYALKYSESQSDLLERIYRETYLEMPYPRMICDPIQGRFLSAISRMIQPKRILEIGTFTGYSAICMAEGLQEGGIIDTIDKNEELRERILGYWQEAGLDGVVNLIIDDAFSAMANLKGPYDLVYLDADKENYAHYIEPILELTQVGSWILADNTLWSGKVLSEKDPETKGIREFNQRVHEDPRLRNVLLPFQDGVMMLERVS